MSEQKHTPERIWACMGGPMVGMFVSGGYTADWPQYVRADIVDDMLEALKAAIANSDANIGPYGRTSEAQDVYDQVSDAIDKEGAGHDEQRLAHRPHPYPCPCGGGVTAMTAKKHTPGPWKVMEDPFISVVTEWTVMDDDEPSSDTYHTIVHDCDYDGWVDLSVPRANARLIAAAPEMLEALKMAFYQMVGLDMAEKVKENGWRWPEDAPPTVSIVAESARAAISKALTP